MTLLFVRHGETDYNSQNRFQGVSDIPLNRQGKIQSQQSALYYKTHNITKIYTSPLVRAVETAQLIADVCSIPYYVNPVLREICYGDWEGKIKEDLYSSPEWEERKHNFFSFTYPGSYNTMPGESYLLQYEKLVPFFEELMQMQGTILIVAHIGVLRAAKKFFENVTDTEVKNITFSNNSCYAISWVNNKVTTHTYVE